MLRLSEVPSSVELVVVLGLNWKFPMKLRFSHSPPLNMFL